MKFKTIAIGIGGILVFGTLFAKNKASQISAIIQNLKFKVSRINSFKLKSDHILIDLDLLLQNPTPEEFSLNTGTAIQLHKIEVFTAKGIKVADAYKQVNNIVINAFGEMLLSNIQVIVPTENLGSTLYSFVSQGTNTTLITKAHVTILGKNYII
ncbi:hypothetical protein [Bizionia myxarmorum]|uniref:Uncharacterized protein n=1 Tax=Bizionia myxarmorum TaxID=291186 RepID=A0A5D0RCP0_9FLAO|nr:hypothetical protein [Bizionia myxarmorum]TYB78344.1 hypothetical protein ES674_00760 [Bizionia myxarmorum]